MRWREGHPPGHGVEVLENDLGHKVGILESGWGILKPVNIIDDDGCMYTGDYMHDLFEPWGRHPVAVQRETGEERQEGQEETQEVVGERGNLMPQSYADRVSARPGYATYRNRKKYYRSLRQAERISESDYEMLVDEAYREYQWDPTRRPPRRSLVLEGVLHHGRCESARGTDCYCYCEGQEHSKLLTARRDNP